MPNEVENLIERAKNLTASQRAAFDAEWNKMGKVKRRWAAFVAGAIAASALWIVCLWLFGCSSSPPVAQATQTGPNSACFPGPTVVE